MATQKLRVMPAVEVPPSDASILQPNASPLFTGSGDLSLLCGGCEAALAHNIHPGQVQGIFIVCPHCQAMNAVDE